MADSKKDAEGSKKGKRKYKRRMVVNLRRGVVDFRRSYTDKILLVSISKICKSVGYNTISSRAFDLFLDVTNTYFRNLSVSLHNYTELFNRTEPQLSDIQLVMQDNNISLEDLMEYINNVRPMPLNQKIPMYPVQSTSQMNFLKPGSNEMVIRPMHIHEHLPPMYAEEGSDNTSRVQSMLPLNFGFPSSSSTSSAPSEPVQPVHKASELVSVTMTSSGFLSHAREGKLPDSKPPSSIMEAYLKDERLKLQEIEKNREKEQYVNGTTGVCERSERKKFRNDHHRSSHRHRHHRHRHKHRDQHSKLNTKSSTLRSDNSDLSKNDAEKDIGDEETSSVIPTESDKQERNILKRICMRESKLDNAVPCIEGSKITDLAAVEEGLKNDGQNSNFHFGNKTEFRKQSSSHIIQKKSHVTFAAPFVTKASKKEYPTLKSVKQDLPTFLSRRKSNCTTSSSSDEETEYAVAKKNDTLKNVFGPCLKNQKQSGRQDRDYSGDERDETEEDLPYENAVKLDPVEPNFSQAKTISSIFLKKNQRKFPLDVVKHDESGSDGERPYKVHHHYRSSSEESHLSCIQNSEQMSPKILEPYYDYSEGKPIKAIYEGIELNEELDYIPSSSSEDKDSSNDEWSMTKKYKSFDKEWGTKKKCKTNKRKKKVNENAAYDIMPGESEIVYKSKATGIYHVAVPKKRGRPKSTSDECEECPSKKKCLNQVDNALEQEKPFKIPQKCGRPRKILYPFEDKVRKIEFRENKYPEIEISEEIVNESDFFRIDRPEAPMTPEINLLKPTHVKGKRGRPRKIPCKVKLNMETEIIAESHVESIECSEIEDNISSYINSNKPRGRGRPPRSSIKNFQSKKKKVVQSVGTPKKRGRPRKCPPPVSESPTMAQLCRSDISEEENNGRTLDDDRSSDNSDSDMPHLEKEIADEEYISRFNHPEKLSEENVENEQVMKFTQVRPIGPGLIPAFISIGPFTSSSKLPMSFLPFEKLNHPDMPDLPFPPRSMMQTSSSPTQLKSISSQSAVTDHSHSSIQLKPSILNLPSLLLPVASSAFLLEERNTKKSKQLLDNQEENGDRPIKRKLSSNEKKMKKDRKKFKKEKKLKKRKKKEEKRQRKLKNAAANVETDPKELMDCDSDIAAIERSTTIDATLIEQSAKDYDAVSVKNPIGTTDHEIEVVKAVAKMPIRLPFVTKASLKYIPEPGDKRAKVENSVDSDLKPDLVEVQTGGNGDKVSGQRYSLHATESVDEDKCCTQSVKSKQNSKKITPIVNSDLPQFSYFYDKKGNKVWLCPVCRAKDDGTPMIACDKCDAWYHWACVGIDAVPKTIQWYCPNCAKKLK